MESLLEVDRPNYALQAAIAVAVLVLVAAGGWLFWRLLLAHEHPQRRVVGVALIRAQPPPEKPLEKPPEPPPIKQEEIKLDEPKPQAQPKAEEPQSASDRVNLDTDQTGDSRGFDVGANKGGRDITLGGSAAASVDVRWYVGILQTHFNSELNKNARLRQTGYRAEVWVWLTESGRVRRVELANSTGDPKVDKLLQQTLMSATPLSRPPPAGMEQPVRLRVVSSGAS